MRVPATCEVVVDQEPPPEPPPVESVPQTGTPPTTFKTSPVAPIPSFVSIVLFDAYRMSPVVYDAWPVPPRVAARVPMVSSMAIPNDEVANCSHVFPAPPIKSDEEATEVRPVPPRVGARLPLHEGVRVKVPEELVMESPMLVSEEVARVMAPV